jgi:tRNA (cmo5U34)-methyltransferase
MREKDRLYELEITEPADFVFDQRVVSVFPDMVNRSIPGYGTIVPMIGMMARRYATPGSRLYDLGCSLGAVSLAMRAAVREAVAEIVAVDNSAEMIERFEHILDETPEGRGPIRTIRQDILDTEISNASVVVMNFTLQFLDPQRRAEMIGKVFNGLNPGGVLLLSEKITFDDPAEQALQTEWHHDFKRAQGYSDLEIAAKRDALENVMKPESLDQHHERLAAAGFEACYRWFQGFNFISLAAFRRR